MRACTVCGMKMRDKTKNGLCWEHYTAAQKAAARPRKLCTQCGEPEPNGSKRKGNLCKRCITLNAEANPKYRYTPIHRRTIASLISAASMIAVVPRADIVGPSRFREHVRVRQAVMYLARKDGHSYPFIGTRLGGRDHSTAIHGCHKAAEIMVSNARFASFVARIDAEAGEWAA